MISPEDVGLLIFDMDGTIFPTTRPVFEAVKKAFAAQDWPVAFTGSDLERFFGFSSGELYGFITPPGKSPEKVRDMVRAEYPAAFREFAATYPGVKETLSSLRKRDYLLALYSNASTKYFDIVISALGLRECFDYFECIGENDLTKTELVGKIMRRFGRPAAVVGDRVHDIEAARENGCLSVGALYGYGKDEPRHADITIERFVDLLVVFDRRLPVFGKILEEIDARKSSERPFVVGVNGIDTSGKTIFTESLDRFLTSKERRVQVINLDDFHNPRHIRNTGDDPVTACYHKGFDIDTLVRRLLVPLRENKEYSVSLTLLDLLSDRYEVEKSFSFTKGTIVLLEGVYLFRKELAPYIDYKIFLDTPFQESRRRAAARDIPRFGADIMRRYDEKYFPAQALYLESYPPRDVADMIIDNVNWEYPAITYQRG